MLSGFPLSIANPFIYNQVSPGAEIRKKNCWFQLLWLCKESLHISLCYVYFCVRMILLKSALKKKSLCLGKLSKRMSQQADKLKMNYFQMRGMWAPVPPSIPLWNLHLRSEQAPLVHPFLKEQPIWHIVLLGIHSPTSRKSQTELEDLIPAG